jgi:hypothetical protein
MRNSKFTSLQLLIHCRPHFLFKNSMNCRPLTTPRQRTPQNNSKQHAKAVGALLSFRCDGDRSLLVCATFALYAE